MPVVNSQAREVAFKIVYYGPGLGGKTTSLQHVHATTKPEHRGKMVSLATPVDRTLYFDFLPLRVPDFKDLTVRLQLFTVPGQVYYNATRKLVLTGADGIIFVADSQRSRVEANLESLRNLQENLEEQGRSLDEMPHVLQYNKRDLVELVPIEEMEQRLNMHAAPSFASVASSGDGVYEALEAITRAVVEDFEKRMPEHRELIIGQLTVPEGGLADALRKVPTETASERSASPEPVGNLPLDLRTRAARAVPTESKAQPTEEPGTNPGVGPRESERDETQVVSYTDTSRLQPEETPARTKTDAAAFSLCRLWPHSDREVVRTIEAALVRGDWVTAVSDSATLVERTLAATARLAGESGATLSPAASCMLLGVDGRKYLEFHRVVSDVRRSCMPSELEALQAYVFAITLRQARTVLASE
jgi:signal recognition particle receptor subunit beta